MSTAVDTPRFIRSEKLEALPPPNLARGPIAWIRENLFSGVFNTILTLVVLYLLYITVPPIMRFLFIDAVWIGTDRAACRADMGGNESGACWAFIWSKLTYFIYGSYTGSERWRVDAFFVLLAVGVTWMLWLKAPRRDIGAAYFFWLFPVLSYVLLTGGNENGACWAFIWSKLTYFIYGSYTGSERWRVNAFFVLLAVGVTWMLWLKAPRRDIGAAYFFWLFPVLSYVLLTGGNEDFGLRFWAGFALLGALVMAVFAFLASLLKTAIRPALLMSGGIVALIGVTLLLVDLDFGLLHVPTSLWGGVLVTLLVATVGIVFSLPFGIVLALGRRSKLPIVRMASVIFIEFVRGVPLITVLIMANTMLPLFLPGDMTVDRLLRPLIGTALFASAYMAEVVRGGLQAMPKGQYEGAMSLGLNYPQMMTFIILPQALRIVIPGIVNTFIGLFKDTSLVAIVGIFDLIKTIEASRIDPNWSAPMISYTGYAFAALFYFVFCYGMSRYSLGVERRLAAGQNR